MSSAEIEALVLYLVIMAGTGLLFLFGTRKDQNQQTTISPAVEESIRKLVDSFVTVLTVCISGFVLLVLIWFTFTMYSISKDLQKIEIPEFPATEEVPSP